VFLTIEGDKISLTSPSFTKDLGEKDDGFLFAFNLLTEVGNFLRNRS